MPVVKVKGGYKVEGSRKVFKTKTEAERHLRAIKARKKNSENSKKTLTKKSTLGKRVASARMKVRG